jgi:hypothetical protein
VDLGEDLSNAVVGRRCGSAELQVAGPLPSTACSSATLIPPLLLRE